MLVLMKKIDNKSKIAYTGNFNILLDGLICLENINNNLYVETIQELLLNNDVVEQKILSNSAKKMKRFKKTN